MDENEIKLDGFQVVSGDYFYVPKKLYAPLLTIWDGRIGFSKQDLLLLNVCENVLIQINSEQRRIIVSPTISKDKDAVRWIQKLDPLEARKIPCKKLTDTLYTTWSWDKDRIYRAEGKLVTPGNKVMILFDFSDPESWTRPEAKKY